MYMEIEGASNYIPYKQKRYTKVNFVSFLFLVHFAVKALVRCLFTKTCDQTTPNTHLLIFAICC